MEWQLITVVDDSRFTAEDFENWLWITFTRSNQQIDIYGLNSLVSVIAIFLVIFLVWMLK